MKDQYQGDILVAGSAALVHSLTELGLVDEYRLMVHPVVLGTGKRLFASACPDLELVESRKGGPTCCCSSTARRRVRQTDVVTR